MNSNRGRASLSPPPPSSFYMCVIIEHYQKLMGHTQNLVRAWYTFDIILVNKKGGCAPCTPSLLDPPLARPVGRYLAPAVQRLDRGADAGQTSQSHPLHQTQLVLEYDNWYSVTVLSWTRHSRAAHCFHRNDSKSNTLSLGLHQNIPHQYIQILFQFAFSLYDKSLFRLSEIYISLP